MPGVHGPIEGQDLDRLVKRYGKTIFIWRVDKGDDAFPLGLSQIMMSLTRDDNRFNILLDVERENRPYIKGPEHGIRYLTNS
ncbi:hypothetical protein MKW92_030119 [Papaver armeniacum]|nr:hypothetical protein MKW92_030119 [Papaver armeniacum]